MENKDLYSDEIWADVEGYVGCYQVSTLGRVRNVKTGYLLGPTAGSHGYLQVNLYKRGCGRTTFLIHRLVAAAFIPNPNNLPTVNHKDEDKTNNCVENLEWMSHKDNDNYGTRNQRISKPVSQYTKDGELIATYCSMTAAATVLNISLSSIARCASGVYKTAGGYV